MEIRQDTTVSLPKHVKTKMDRRKPKGVTWGYSLTKELGLEDSENTVTSEDAELAIRKFSEAAAEAAGVSPEEVEEAVRSRLEDLGEETNE